MHWFRSEQEARSSASPHDRVGSYELLEPIGAGGQGEVWLARHVGLDRRAAVKLLLDQHIDDRFRKKFTHEARATAALSSKHTVRVYDFGDTADGRLFYAMEWLDGMDLQQMVDRFGPLPPPRAVYLLTQACESLAEAHSKDIVHRDIKPSNLIVTADFEPDLLKVVDFGLAGTQGCDRAAGLVVSDGVAGTPAYLPPEAIESACPGECDVDGRADVYSLGCVAFWLLTGRLVFEASTAEEAALAHVLRTPEDPAAFATFPVPAALSDAILACLAKSPEARPDASQLRSRLLASVSKEDAWNVDRGWRWWNDVRSRRQSS